MVEKAYQGLEKKALSKVIRLGSISLLLSALWLFNCKNVEAQSFSLISDEETETFLADVAKPLFGAANVRFNRNNIYIVSDNSLNAFVADGNNLFINTGTIIAAEDADEISGVIAHETGHIQGGHILRQKLKSKEMQEITLASALLAGAGAVASGRGDVGMAVLLGSQSSALTNYTMYRTEEERSADEAAMKILGKTQQSPHGMLRFMKRISQQNNLNGIEETPYFRTHPVTRERIGFFEENVKNSTIKPNGHLQKEFERVKAKLSAYLNEPRQTFQKYPLSDQSIPAVYAHAIAYFKQLKFAQALAATDKLIAAEPDNAYFHELKGQIYLETGKVAEAKKEYQKALALRPNSGLLQVSLAQAILEDNPTKEETKQAINLLNKAIISRPSGFVWMLLAQAYGINGEEAYANYAAAEYSLRIGAKDIAKNQAEVAKKLSKSAQLNTKIDDILERIKDISK